MTETLFEYDRAFLPLRVGGCDEAGRGPLAGPVVCAAVFMPLENMIDGVNDSKKLSEKKREELYESIVRTALAFNVAVVDRGVIDEINILEATKLGMREASGAVERNVDIMLIDAVKLKLGVPVKAIIRGDGLSYNIAAASIVAKVTRDRLMREMELSYPGYGFCRHKGYGTREHIDALKRLGPCSEHRRTFIGHFWGESDEK